MSLHFFEDLTPRLPLLYQFGFFPSELGARFLAKQGQTMVMRNEQSHIFF